MPLNACKSSDYFNMEGVLIVDISKKNWLGCDTPESLQEDLKKCFLMMYRKEPNFKIRLLRYSENIIYKIAFPFSDPVVLRVHRTGYHTSEEIESELVWMRELTENTKVKVPYVFRGKDGKFLQHFTSSGGNVYTI